MDTPESMKAELGRWNNGEGIDLESWACCSGNFALAVGYLAMFWPRFTRFEGYILREGFSVDSLRGFESQPGSTPHSVEWVMNHFHIADLHRHEEDLLTEDKVVLIGRALTEMYQAKLVWQFPETPCIVKFYEPEQDGDLIDYQISFWQAKHEPRS